MKFYRGLLNHNGKSIQQIPIKCVQDWGTVKARDVGFGVPASEIIVLSHVHGPAAVKNLELVGEAEISNARERQRLGLKYNREDRNVIGHLFGPVHMPLPQHVEDAAAQAGVSLDAIAEREEAELAAKAEAKTAPEPVAEAAPEAPKPVKRKPGRPKGSGRKQKRVLTPREPIDEFGPAGPMPLQEAAHGEGEATQPTG